MTQFEKLALRLLAVIAGIVTNQVMSGLTLQDTAEVATRITALMDEVREAIR